jgi:hypothetical protein
MRFVIVDKRRSFDAATVDGIGAARMKMAARGR